MAPKKIIAEVTEHRDLAPDVFEKTFKVLDSSDFSYEAGNYLTVKVLDGKDPLVTRAYTFASAPLEKNIFKLCVKVFYAENGEAGRGSGYLKALPVGEQAEFFGPICKKCFHTDDNSTDPLLLLGTGTGIAPLKAVAEELTEKGSPRPIKLFLGVSYPEDVFYEEEFSLISKKNPNFDFKIAVSRPTEDWNGPKGRLPVVLESEKIDKNSEAFVCGSIPAMTGIREKLLEFGLDENKIDAEGYGDL